MDEKPFENREDQDSQLFGTLHADLIGPMNPEARWSHAKFKPSHQRRLLWIWVRVQPETQRWSHQIDHGFRQSHRKQKFHKRTHTLKTDNGGEFVNSTLQKHCQERGITLMTSVAYNPELNGRAERRNRTHIEGARDNDQRFEVGERPLGRSYVNHVYIRNRCPSSILPDNITPYEKVFNQPPSINQLTSLSGRNVLSKYLDETRSKLDDKARECRLIGFEGESIYVVVDAEKRKLRSRNIIFVEGTSNRTSQKRTSTLGTSDNGTLPRRRVRGMPKKKRTRSEVWGNQPYTKI